MVSENAVRTAKGKKSIKHKILFFGIREIYNEAKIFNYEKQ
jgi:hypothetical protein